MLRPAVEYVVHLETSPNDGTAITGKYWKVFFFYKSHMLMKQGFHFLYPYLKVHLIQSAHDTKKLTVT